MKKANEKARFRPISQGEISCFCPLASSSLKAALAEKRNARMPRYMACPSVPIPRKIGNRNSGYFSETRLTGISSVTISPLGCRTATQ